MKFKDKQRDLDETVEAFKFRAWSQAKASVKDLMLLYINMHEIYNLWSA